jgi:hypothetical protein
MKLSLSQKKLYKTMIIILLSIILGMLFFGNYNLIEGNDGSYADQGRQIVKLKKQNNNSVEALQTIANQGGQLVESMENTTVENIQKEYMVNDSTSTGTKQQRDVAKAASAALINLASSNS